MKWLSNRKKVSKSLFENNRIKDRRKKLMNKTSKNCSFLARIVKTMRDVSCEESCATVVREEEGG